MRTRVRANIRGPRTPVRTLRIRVYADERTVRLSADGRTSRIFPGSQQDVGKEKRADRTCRILKLAELVEELVELVVDLVVDRRGPRGPRLGGGRSAVGRRGR